MTERVLVTGGAGYIGAVLVPMLLAEGYHVTVLDHFREGTAALADCCRYDTFDPVRGDVRDLGVLRSLVAEADAVIPLAALVGVKLCAENPLDAQTVNTTVIRALLMCLGSQQKLIFPATEPISGASVYAVTKAAAERVVLGRGDGVVLRLASKFGMSPSMRIDLVVNDFVYRAMTDGSVVLYDADFPRAYTHVRDGALAFVHALRNYDRMSGNGYNVCGDERMTKRTLCSRIQARLPDFSYTVADAGHDPHERDPAMSNDALVETGWAPTLTVDDGIRELIRGYTTLRDSRFRSS